MLLPYTDCLKTAISLIKFLNKGADTMSAQASYLCEHFLIILEGLRVVFIKEILNSLLMLQHGFLGKNSLSRWNKQIVLCLADELVHSLSIAGISRRFQIFSIERSQLVHVVDSAESGEHFSRCLEQFITLSIPLNFSIQSKYLASLLLRELHFISSFQKLLGHLRGITNTISCKRSQLIHILAVHIQLITIREHSLSNFLNITVSKLAGILIKHVHKLGKILLGGYFGDRYRLTSLQINLNSLSGGRLQLGKLYTMELSCFYKLICYNIHSVFRISLDIALKLLIRLKSSLLSVYWIHMLLWISITGIVQYLHLPMSLYKLIT